MSKRLVLDCGCEIFHVLGYMGCFCKRHLTIFQKVKDKIVITERRILDESDVSLWFNDFKRIVKKLEELTNEKELKKLLEKKEKFEIDEDEKSNLFTQSETVH